MGLIRIQVARDSYWYSIL